MQEMVLQQQEVLKHQLTEKSITAYIKVKWVVLKKENKKYYIWYSCQALGILTLKIRKCGLDGGWHNNKYSAMATDWKCFPRENKLSGKH